MNVLRFISVAAVLMLAMSSVFAGDKYGESLTEFKKSPVVSSFFGKSYGYALFPTVGKGGMGIGGAHGKGQVYSKGKMTGSTKMSQLTIGLQLGGQAFSQIIFFENKKSFDSFTSGNFEFGAQATAVAITASANAQVGTTGNAAGASSKADAGKQTAQYSKGMATFTYAKGGLMYEATLGGQKFSYKAAK